MPLHQYNTFRYNESQYNADASFLVLACVETISSVDSIGGKAATKPLAETITATDATMTKSQTHDFAEALTLTDAVTKSITNKGLAESIRVNDWIQIRRMNTGSTWSN